MKTTNIAIWGVISFVWILSESLAYENNTQYEESPFTINANPYGEIKLLVPSASDNIENRKDGDPTEKPESMKTHKNKEEEDPQNKMRVHPNNHHKKELTNLEQKEQKINHQSKKQNWELPISPITTSDPKETNSSKRQILHNGEGGFTNQFVPSQELGPIGEGGFLPHRYLPHTPTIPVYLAGKEEQQDNSEEYRLNLLAHRGMVAFEHDFGNLRSKYPELDGLMNEYPVLEEVMKKKLAEKFQYTTKSKYFFAGNSEENSDENVYRPNEAFIKVASTESSDKLPSYAYELPKPIRGVDGKKPTWDMELSTTLETPFAGEFYQAHRFPVSSYANQDDDDKKKETFDNKYPGQVESKPYKPVSPWKRAIHLLTAFLPVGLLISALTPNVVTINNTADKIYPIRQRSLPEDLAYPQKMTNPLVDFMNGQYEESERAFGGDPDCNDKLFCEMSKKGQFADGNAIEKILWTLAHSTPDHIADKAGMKKLFKSVKTGKCEEFLCKKLPKTSPEIQNIYEESNQPKKRRRSRFSTT